MKKVFEKYVLSEPAVNGSKLTFMLTENGADATVKSFNVTIRKRIYDANKYFVIKAEELVTDIDSKIGGSNYNLRKTDYVIVENLESENKVFLYFIELGPHTPKELEQKFNATFTTINSFISRYFQKKRIFKYTCYYRLFHFDGNGFKKDMLKSQSKGYAQKIHKDKEYNYFCFAENQCSLALLKDKQINQMEINGIEKIFIHE